MAGLDKNTIFFLKGDEFKDSSSNATTITASSMTSSQIVNENNSGVDIKAIDFNNTGYLKFNLDGRFLQNDYTIDWWEKDGGNATATSAVFTNITTSTGNFYFAIANTKSKDPLRNIVNVSTKATTSYNLLNAVSIGNEVINEWVHRAVVFNKENGIYRFFENGKLFTEIEKGASAFPERCDTFQMNRFRATGGALQKKIYNFRVSNIARWKNVNEFIPQKEVYDDTPEPIDTEYQLVELEEGATQNDVVKSLITITNKLAQEDATSEIKTYDYTNSDGMIESYNWFYIGALKVMYINVKMSEAEYNSGSGGLIMKTLNFPEQVQIFDNIIMANITSYCREGENTLSRIVQNAEIISNVSLRGRWRHTDNTYPKIDRFTIMCLGF